MPRITNSRCVLAVADLDASTRFYTDVLGFERDFGDHNWYVYLNVDDADGLHAEVAGRGAEILSRPATRPWGLREFTVRTPDGHRIVFGQPVSAVG